MRSLLLTLLLATIAGIAPWSAGAAVSPGTKYAEGNLTLEAKSATVGELLQAIARTAGVDVYVASGFQAAGGERITVRIENEPIEEAIRRILQGYNYAAVYVQEGEGFRIAALKVYPEGEHGAAMQPLYLGNVGSTPQSETGKRGEVRTVIVSSTGESTTYGGLQSRVLAPSRTVFGAAGSGVTGGRPALPGLQEPWFALQVQTERDEAARYEELMALQQRVAGAGDAESQKALSLAFADEAAKFHAFKRANLNKIESLKRISQFRAVSSQ